MKRTKGSQSELGILYQYGVTALLAAKLSTDVSVEDYVIYSSDDSAGKFDDIVARVKIKEQDAWYLSLVQVKYKEIKKLDVSDIINGKSVKYFLSDYIKSFNKIVTDSKLVCRKGIASENIQFSIFCNQSIQTPVILQKERTFQLDLCEYYEKIDINKTLIPFGNKSWKFVCSELNNLECQSFFSRCYLCLEQPNYTELNQHIEKACDITSALAIINYIKDYFNNDYLYRQGLTMEVFEVELQRIRYIDAIPPITSLLDLVDDARISVWKDITLNHDITTVDCYADVEIERCLYSCVIQNLNSLLNINIDWSRYVGKTCNLDSEIISKFMVHSKTKKTRFWISPPSTLRTLLMELWKFGDLPLILKTHSKLNNFERYMHLKRNYIIIDDWTDRCEEVSASKLKIFSNLNSIHHLELKEKILTSLLVSLQGRAPRNLKDILQHDEELMSNFTCVNILDTMKKRTAFLKEDYYKGNHYLAFIIEDGDSTDTTQPREPYTIGGNTTIRCHPSKMNECMKTMKTHAIYKNYAIYQIRRIGEKIVLAEGDRCQLRHHFVDQYNDPLYIGEEDEFIPIIGKAIVPNELHYVQRHFKRATILSPFFNLQQKLICLLSGDVHTAPSSLSFTTIDNIQNISTFIENKSYFIKIQKEERQYCWRKLYDFRCPILDINVRDGKMELLKHKNCKNLNLHISYDSEKYSGDELFEEIGRLENSVTVIVGDAGVGKTSFLKWFCNHHDTNKYIVFYDLINFQLYLTKSKSLLIDPLEFIFKEHNKGVSKKYSNFLSGVWKRKKILCILDSFDEVRSAYERQVIEFIQHLTDSGIQIVIATRLWDCKILLEQFNVHIIKIEPFESSKQNDYLPWWQLNENLLENVSPELVTIPLHLNFLRMISIGEERLSNITKFSLYEKVISMKIRRCLQRTTRIVYNSEIDRTILLFEKLALVVMFGKETIENELLWACDKEVFDYTKFGIVTNFEDETYPVFYHYTFVEFLVAQWISKYHQLKMYKGTARHLYKTIINENKLHILNILSEDSDLHKSILQTDIHNIKVMIKESYKCLDVLDKLGRTALAIAVICCGHSHRLLVSYQIVEIIVKSMLRNHNDMTKCDTIAALNWSDYFQPDTFDFAELFGIVETIKKYLNLQRQNVEKCNTMPALFPSKHFHSCFRTALQSASGQMIADLVLLQNVENKMFCKLYKICQQSIPDTFSLNKEFVIEGKLSTIHIVCIYGSVPMIQHLIQSGADVISVDEFSCTPLHYSIMRPSLLSPEKMININTNEFTDEGEEATKFLLEAGADPNIPIYFGKLFPLCLAIKARKVNTVRMLLQNGANVRCLSEDKNTPLHFAAMEGCADIVRCLLEYRAPTFLKNINGETPMVIASKQGHTTVAELLAVAAKNEGIVDDLREVATGVILSDSIEQDFGNTPLHYAACYSYTDQAQLLLRKGADVHVQNKKGNTPLHKVGVGGSADIATLLLERGANINFQNKYGETALYIATYFMNINVVDLLLKKGADVNVPKIYNHTTLHAAVEGGCVDIVKILVKGGAKINRQNKGTVVPLHIAAEKGYKDIVEYFLKCGVEYNNPDAIGNTALHHAVLTGNTNICKILLKGGADINIRNMQGHTPLQLATIKEDEDTVQLLLEWRANTNVQDIDGYTPLHIAAHLGHEIIANLLLDKGAEVNAQSKNGDTVLNAAVMGNKKYMIQQLFKAEIRTDYKSDTAVLHLAASKGWLDIATLLLSKGINVNTRDKYGNTALHKAVQGGQTEMVELLLQNHAHVNTTSEDGFLPLHDAVGNAYSTIIMMLLDNGADINAKSKNGNTALLIASKVKNKDIIRLLLEANSNIQKQGSLTMQSSAVKPTSASNKLIYPQLDVNLGDSYGLTPLHLAAQDGHIDIVELLLQIDACVNVKNRHGFTPFHLAVKGGHIYITSILLNNGAHINTELGGATALHLKTAEGNLDFVKLLVEKGADVNIKTKAGLTPIHVAILYDHVNILKVLLDGDAKLNEAGEQAVLALAVRNKNINMVRILVKAGANMLIDNRNGTTVLHHSVCTGQVDLVKLLMEENVDVNAQDSRGYTPLHFAVIIENIDIVQLLLKGERNSTHVENRVPSVKEVAAEDEIHVRSLQRSTDNIASSVGNKINVNIQSDDGSTPLHFAVVHEHLDIIHLLLKNGANGTTLDVNGKTPLHSAIFQQRADIVRLLLTKTEDVNVQGRLGYTPLHLSIQVQNVDILWLLLEFGATLNIQDKKGNTPLHIAVHEGNAGIVTLLLEMGADVNIGQEYGDIPLHLAVSKQLIDITRSLLAKGSNVNAQNNDGATPLHLAAEQGSTVIAELLSNKGANVNSQDEMGRSPLHYAVIENRANIVPVLLRRGAATDLKATYGITPLEIATYNQNARLIQLLLNKEVDAQNETSNASK